MKMVCLEWMAFLDLLVLRVHPVSQEIPEPLELVVYLVNLDSLVNLERWESLDYLVKMAWTVFLELMVLRDPGEREEQTVLMESLGLRVMMDLPDLEGPLGKGEKRGHQGREVLMEQEETEVFQESRA